MRNTCRALIDAWRETSLDGPIYLLPGDEWLTDEAGRVITDLTGYQQFVDSEHTGDLGGKRLHLNLIPLPFLGDLLNATLVLLLANPGAHADDYYFEERFKEYRRALRRNLRQEKLEYPFLFLDPSFACTPGAEYWLGRLACLLLEWCRQKKVTYRSALKSIASQLAVVQLVPYHSRNFNLPKRLRASRSVRLALRCGQELKQDPKRHIIVARAVKAWGLNPARKGIVNYTGSAPRSASFSCSSQGWAVMLQGLGLDFVSRCPRHQKRG